MKGIDYVTAGQKQTLTVHFYLRKTVFFALSGTRTHVSLITSRVLGPVWGYRGKDTLPSEEKLGSGDPHAAKSPR